MPNPNGHTGESSRVAVLRADGEYKLVSREAVATGGILFLIDGEPTDTPTRYSVQVGHALHLDLPNRYGPEEIMDRFYWRFMNHCCEPNAMIRGRELVALRPIEPWEDITFHYNSTEYELAEPFDCRCGSDRCEGKIQGFGTLSETDRERLRPWLADHLLALLDGHQRHKDGTAVIAEAH
jgi:hypothetical protein